MPKEQKKTDKFKFWTSFFDLGKNHFCASKDTIKRVKKQYYLIPVRIVKIKKTNKQETVMLGWLGQKSMWLEPHIECRDYFKINK